jgi:hypothetical protein
MPKVPKLKPDKGSLLQYFNPALGSLCWMVGRTAHHRVGAGGLSAGGWTTTLLAAVEPRIKASYAVAGSLPMKLHDKKDDAGDWEQITRDLLDVVDYSDLYLMGAADPGRRVYLMQFPAHAGDAGADQGLVADDLEGQADQDRRESREPRPLCYLPDGRGRHRTANVPRDFAAHRGATAAATTIASTAAQ